MLVLDRGLRVLRGGLVLVLDLGLVLVLDLGLCGLAGGTVLELDRR